MSWDRATQVGCLDDLLTDRSAVHPEAIALIAPDGRSVSYRELVQLVHGIGASLRVRGIERDDRVGIVLPNGLDAAVAFFGVACAAVSAPLNPAYQSAEFDFYLSDLGAKALIVGGDSAVAREAAASRGVEVFEIDALMAEASARPVSEFDETLRGRPEDVCLILHTSGTTSRPKMVPLTHLNLIRSAFNVCQTLELCEADRCLNVMPLFHIHGLVAALLSSLTAGGSVVCSGGFAADEFFDWLSELKPTWYTAVPTIHQSVLARLRTAESLPDHNLRFVRSSSSALAAVTMLELEAAFGVPVVEAYGMTEAAHQMTSNPLPPAQRKPGSVGRPAGPEVAIMGADHQLLGFGEIGEVVIRGENVTSGYLGNPGLGDDASVAGWFRTGDQGYLDDDEYLHLTGRLKEIINRGGEKISPVEVDEVLMAHPAVAQAVTFAVIDSRLGEDVGAAIVLKPAMTASPFEIQKFAAKRLAYFKVPRKVMILDSIPKGPTGKIQRIGMAERLGVGSGAVDADLVPRSASEATELESELLAIWRDFLAQPDLDLQHSFFEWGGDSLAAVELVVAMSEQLALDIALHDLFDAPTVEALALAIENRSAVTSSEISGNGNLHSVRPEGRKPALFFVHGQFREHDAIPAYCLALGRFLDDRPLYVVQPSGASVELASSLGALAGAAARSISELQPRGPYVVVGYCAGAVLAVEIARCLIDAGEDAELVLIEARAPRWRMPQLQRLMIKGAVALLGDRRGRNAYLVAKRFVHVRPWAARRKSDAMRESMEAEDDRIRGTVAYRDLLATHLPLEFGHPMTLMLPEDEHGATPESALGWDSLAASVELVAIDGGHSSCVTSHTGSLAQKLDSHVVGRGL